MTCSFADVCTALMLVVTIPVTTASVERSFSKLKLIKTYLRKYMGQERLRETWLFCLLKIMPDLYTLMML